MYPYFVCSSRRCEQHGLWQDHIYEHTWQITYANTIKATWAAGWHGETIYLSLVETAKGFGTFDEGLS